MVPEDDEDARFGCPCSAIPTQAPNVPLTDGTPDGGVILVHSTGPEHGDNVNRYAARYSADGVDGWSDPRYIRVEGEEWVGTFTGTITSSLAADGRKWKFIGGYEGWQGEACLAKSDDFFSWSNLYSRGDHPGGEVNDDDGDTGCDCDGDGDGDCNSNGNCNDNGNDDTNLRHVHSSKTCLPI